MPMLEVDRLTVRYGPLEAVRSISFVVETGQIVALIGSNGAGKSVAANSRARCPAANSRWSQSVAP